MGWNSLLESAKPVKKFFSQLCLGIENDHTLNKLLAKYYKSEDLTGNCESGGSKNIDIRRSVAISRLPNVLVIQLKRFNKREDGTITKINDYITFSNVLDVKDFLSEELQLLCMHERQFSYKLASVVCHIGDSIENGHYVTICNRNDVNDEYYIFHDKHIDAISKNEVFQSQMYIFIYNKQSNTIIARFDSHYSDNSYQKIGKHSSTIAVPTIKNSIVLLQI